MIYSKVDLSKFDAKNNYVHAIIIKRVLWYIIKRVFFLSAIPFPSYLKAILLRLFGAKVGSGLILKPRVNIQMPWNLMLGDNVWIGEEVFILNFNLINVGDNVCISQRAFLCGGNHDFLDPAMGYLNGPIHLNNGCWIGACSFIGPNVSVGIDTVVYAHSVVIKSLPENAIFAGNPAVFKRTRWV